MAPRTLTTPDLYERLADSLRKDACIRAGRQIQTTEDGTIITFRLSNRSLGLAIAIEGVTGEDCWQILDRLTAEMRCEV